MKIYNLEDYNQIIFEGFSYQLPESILTVVNDLRKEIELFAPLSSVQVDDKLKRGFQFGGKKIKNRKNENAEDWNTVKSFKTTVIDKKEGVDKILNDIRACLNKISSKNYESQKECIFKHMEELLPIDIQKVSNALFDVAGNNKFNSIIYANLLKEMVDLFPNLSEHFDLFLMSYKQSISSIIYADPNSDYDKYCENNKLNDRRKAISTYLSNLNIIGFIDNTVVIEVVTYLLQYINEYIDSENKTNEVEEITENLYLFITLLNNHLKNEDKWYLVIENIENIAKMKSKEKKSLSSRAVFKYMDILDALKTK
uniref:MIF4G domain-containing protein n=1 Tax=viral metagenome TaxID=1070528 RepID=A0A6C0B6W5_9ZZZZ